MNRSLLAVAVLLVSLSGCARQLKVTPPASSTRVEVEPYQPTPGEQQELQQLLSRAVLHFDYDAASLTEQDRITLQRVASALRVRPWAAVRIKGHCDERGTLEYNIALGQRRAEVARGYLVALGIEPAAVESVSYGSEIPAVDGHDEEAWAQNRRDELEPTPEPLAFEAFATH
jgi:peptidoglycan-associated lipoprotein